MLKNPVSRFFKNSHPENGSLAKAYALVAEAIAATDERNWSEAARLYHEALEIDNSLAHIWVQYGHALKESQKFEEAEAAYRQSLLLDANVADTYLQLGHLLKISGRLLEAEQHYAHALIRDPNMRDARLELSNVGALIGNANISPVSLTEISQRLEKVGEISQKLEHIEEISQRLEKVGEISQKLEHIEEISQKLEKIEEISQRLENVEATIAKFGKNVPGRSETDLHFEDSNELTPYSTDTTRFEKEYSASLYLLTSVGCRSDFFHLPIYNYWCERMGHKPGFHRKQWEFVYITHALYERGCLKPGSKGVGFGVGREPLVDLYASMGCEILATDLGAGETDASDWIEGGMHASNKQALAWGITPQADFDRLVSFRPVNMNQIPEDIRNFDFCYTSCAIEHVGSLQLSKQFVENVLDVLKPGGISVHTTEFVIDSDDETVEEGLTVLWRKRDFREVAEKLRAKGHIVEPLDFYTGRHPVDKHVDLPPFSSGGPHLRLLIGKFKCTSFGLIVRKAA